MSNLVIYITAAFTAGILCANYLKGVLPFLYISSLVIVMIFIWQIYRKQEKIFLIVVLFFIIGTVRFIHYDNIGEMDISHYTGKKIIAYGIIVEAPQVTNLGQEKRRVRYVLSIQNVHAEKGTKETATGRLYISVRQSNKELVYQQGDEVKVAGEIFALHGYNNPGQYDSVAAAQLHDIRGRMSVQGKEISLEGKGSLLWKQHMEVWREKIINNMEKVMPQSHKAILAGMLFGGYGGIPREIIADFSTTGIVHILSVSGSHIALVAGIVTLFGRRLFSRFIFKDKVVPVFAAFVITLYAIFCGLTPPVLRSLIMGLISLGAICLGREKDAIVALALTVLSMLVYQPALVYDLSFQLSFASTAGLVLLHAKTVKILTILPLWLARPLAVTIAAQVGVLPFIAWYFNAFSLSSFVANVMIVPIIEGIVILGLFGALSSLVIGVMGNVSFVICSLLIGLVIQMTEWLAAMPAAKLYAPSIGMIGSIVYYIVVGWAYGYRTQKMMTITAMVKRWPQKSGIVVLLFILCIMVYSFYPRSFSVHFIDVGQGDAALIITPHGRGILVDTGGTIGENTDFDIGYRVVLPYLRHYGIVDLDYLFLTHGHQDHAGGAASIAKEVPIKNIMLSREDYSQAVTNLLQIAPKSIHIAVYEGQIIELDGVVIKVLHADAGINGRGSKNEVSSVVQASYGRFSFLFTGDLPAQGEEEMIRNGRNIMSSVLKVGHHGSKTSSTVGFLKAVAPEYAVISVGANNSFGHPHEETVQRLLAQHSKIYRTDQQGAIVFRTDGSTMSVATFIP